MKMGLRVAEAEDHTYKVLWLGGRSKPELKSRIGKKASMSYQGHCWNCSVGPSSKLPWARTQAESSGKDSSQSPGRCQQAVPGREVALSAQTSLVLERNVCSPGTLRTIPAGLLLLTSAVTGDARARAGRGRWLHQEGAERARVRAHHTLPGSSRSY